MGKRRKDGCSLKGQTEEDHFRNLMTIIQQVQVVKVKADFPVLEFLA